MNQELTKEFKPKCNFTIETLITFISVLIMWACYYIDNNHIMDDNPVWTILWGFGIIVGMNVVFPAWWILIKKKEGLEGMGITKKNLGLAILFSIALGMIRVPDLLKVSERLPIQSILPVFAFNLLSIWEACFLFSWLFTRYNKAFGKGLAAVLTSISIGIYHTGTLKPEQILTLMAWIFLCSLCFAVTDNVFTLWPIYWLIGCSASVIRAYGASGFPWPLAGLMGIILIIQIILLFIVRKKSRKTPHS